MTLMHESLNIQALSLVFFKIIIKRFIVCLMTVCNNTLICHMMRVCLCFFNEKVRYTQLNTQISTNRS